MHAEKVLLEKINGEYSNCRIPGLIRTEKGTLLAYYECRREFSDWADIDLKIIRSSDNGETWTTVKIIPSAGNTLNNPVMIVHGEDIHLLYCKNYNRLFYAKSMDDGLSFSEAEDISVVFENCGFFYSVVAVGPGHGIVHNDTLLIPVWFACNEEDPKAHKPSVIGTIFSKDNGVTWELGEIIGKEKLINPSECALGIDKDEKVLISIRNENPVHQRALAVSDTGYSGWEEVQFSDILTDPICQGSLDSYNGKLFHINCECQTERKDLCIKISEDNFKTAQRILVDEEGGYSDIVVTEDWMYIIYERDLANDGLYFKKIKN